MFSNIWSRLFFHLLFRSRSESVCVFHCPFVWIHSVRVHCYAGYERNERFYFLLDWKSTQSVANTKRFKYLLAFYAVTSQMKRNTVNPHAWNDTFKKINLRKQIAGSHTKINIDWILDDDLPFFSFFLLVVNSIRNCIFGRRKKGRTENVTWNTRNLIMCVVHTFDGRMRFSILLLFRSIIYLYIYIYIAYKCTGKILKLNTNFHFEKKEKGNDSSKLSCWLPTLFTKFEMRQTVN